MNRRNYQKELDELLASFSEKKRLFLHCCCAPCSSYVLEYLHDFFDITVFFYNPNISEACEYQKSVFCRQLLLEKKFICTMPIMNRIFLKKWQKGMKMIQSGGQDAQSVSDFGWRKPQNTQKRVRMTIFVRHFPSALIKMRIY